MEAFESFDNSEDRNPLLEFLNWTRDFLDELVSQGGAPGKESLFFEELRAPMRNAWETVKPRFEELEESTFKLDKEKLSAHGLVGVELRFKLSTVRVWSRRFLNIGSGSILKRLLQAINTLLNSIISAVILTPTPFGTAISEFKDAVMDSIKD